MLSKKENLFGVKSNEGGVTKTTLEVHNKFLFLWENLKLYLKKKLKIQEWIFSKSLTDSDSEKVWYKTPQNHFCTGLGILCEQVLSIHLSYKKYIFLLYCSFKGTVSRFFLSSHECINKIFFVPTKTHTAIFYLEITIFLDWKLYTFCIKVR